MILENIKHDMSNGHLPHPDYIDKLIALAEAVLEYHPYLESVSDTELALKHSHMCKTAKRIRDALAELEKK